MSRGFAPPRLQNSDLSWSWFKHRPVSHPFYKDNTPFGLGLELGYSPPVKVSQSYITTAINEPEYFPIGFFSPDGNVRQRGVPSLIAIIDHGTNLIHGFLRRKPLSLQEHDQIVLDA